MAEQLSLAQQSDDFLARLAKEGDSQALTCLIVRYMPLARARAGSFAQGALDSEDLFQEGMIALLGAVRGYREDGAGSFRTFAATCINNKLRNALVSHMRLKNGPMREFLPLSDQALEGVSASDEESGPEQQVIASEEMKARRDKIQTLLSSFEQQVLTLYLRSFPYEEIAIRLATTNKAVDNALQRVRRKLRNVLISD